MYSLLASPVQKKIPMAITLSKVASYVAANEGWKKFPYKDTVGKTTIGAGFNLDDTGLDDEEITFILEHRLALIKKEIPNRILTWEALSEDQRTALIDMYYNLGWPRLSKFKEMLKAIDKGKYELAAKELLRSKYATQVGKRAERNAELLKREKSL